MEGGFANVAHQPGRLSHCGGGALLSEPSTRKFPSLSHLSTRSLAKMPAAFMLGRAPPVVHATPEAPPPVDAALGAGSSTPRRAWSRCLYSTPGAASIQFSHGHRGAALIQPWEQRNATPSFRPRCCRTGEDEAGTRTAYNAAHGVSWRPSSSCPPALGGSAWPS